MSLKSSELPGSIEEIEKAINEVFPGLTIFARDANLPAGIADIYKKGMILREKAFVDASYRVQGMVTTHRYIILSNHLKDLSNFEHGTNWGLCVANRDSHFKVLGTHCYNEKTVIVLLHLPDDNRWKLFDGIHISLEEELFDKAINSFKQKIERSPIPELTTKEWLQRCEFPIGIDDKGDLWPL